MNIWKVLGVAGLAGVAAAGVIIARDQRQRTQMTPEQIRARLHERFEQLPHAPSGSAVWQVPASPAKRRAWLPRWPRRRAGSVP